VAEASASASTLLDSAVALWSASRLRHRDALLEVGRLLHEYVLARLREGDGLNEADRYTARAVRKVAVEDAGAALGVTRQRVNALISVSQAVACLLGPDAIGRGGCTPPGMGGEDSPPPPPPPALGSLPWHAVRPFSLLVTRARARRTRRARGEGGVRGGCNPPVPMPEGSSRETWAVRPGLEESAPALLRRAAAGGWHWRRCGEAVRLLRGTPAPAWTPAPKSPPGPKDSADATPRDIAADLAGRVLRHPEAALVAALLREELDRRLAAAARSGGACPRCGRRKLLCVCEAWG
jgi:hypothetical protein